MRQIRGGGGEYTHLTKSLQTDKPTQKQKAHSCKIAKNTQRYPHDYRTAKKELYGLYLEANFESSFYCDCPYTSHDKKYDKISCDLQIKGDTINTEHIVPASIIGEVYPCWQDGGRKNCVKTSQEFAMPYSDLHNLQPVVGRLNNKRSNYPFVFDIKNIKNQFGKCGMKISKNLKQVAPPKNKRGAIARTYLYMHDCYRVPLTIDEHKQYLKWHEQNPPTKWEKKRNQIIKKIQGNFNHWIINNISNQKGNK